MGWRGLSVVVYHPSYHIIGSIPTGATFWSMCTLATFSKVGREAGLQESAVPYGVPWCFWPSAFSGAASKGSIP